MHGQNVLGDVLKMDDKLSEACPWETVVLLPRSNKYKLEETDFQAGSNERQEAPKVTYLFTEQTASMYVEYKVVKVNRHGTRQERILGIDREKIYNLLQHGHKELSTQLLQNELRAFAYCLGME